MIESWYPLFEWCEFTIVGQFVRQSLWLFPVIEAFHLVAFALLGGTILVVDLRLMGLIFKDHSPAELWKSARYWRRAALAVMIVTGLLLFLSEAVKCFYSQPFWIKIGSMLLAIVFGFAVTSRIARADQKTPMVTALAAIVTLVLMLVTGSMIWFSELPNWTTIVWIGSICTVLVGVSAFAAGAIRARWENPVWSKLAAVISIVLWATVAWGGRWIGFSG